MILGTGVPLPAESGRPLARLGLVITEDVGRVLPLGILVHQVPLLVQYIRPVVGAVTVEVRVLHRLELFDIVDRRTQVVVAMGERAVRPVLDAEATGVSVVHAHAGLVVAQVVAAFRVARRTVEVRASVMKN